MPGSPLAAVLFDMDGLLVDSEPHWYAAELSVTAAIGGTWTEDDQKAVLGGPLSRCAARMVAVSGTGLDVAEVERRLVLAMADELRAGVSLRPGAAELLGELAAADVVCALVSSSFRVLVDLVLDHVGRTHFPVTVAGDEVRHRKPHPEPYLRATALLGVAPERCVVLEDSMPGLLAAEAAGCHTVGVPDLLPLPAAPGRVVVGSLAELDPAFLRQLVARAA